MKSGRVVPLLLVTLATLNACIPKGSAGESSSSSSSGSSSVGAPSSSTPASTSSPGPSSARGSTSVPSASSSSAPHSSSAASLGPSSTPASTSAVASSASTAPTSSALSASGTSSASSSFAGSSSSTTCEYSPSCGCLPCPPHADYSECRNDACVPLTCLVRYHLCDGACVSALSPATCGALCTPCPQDPHGTTTCNNQAACQLDCAPGYLLCNGACAACPVDAQSTAFACSTGTCAITSCAAGYTRCSNSNACCFVHSETVEPWVVSTGFDSPALAHDNTAPEVHAYVRITFTPALKEVVYVETVAGLPVASTAYAGNPFNLSLAVDPLGQPHLVFVEFNTSQVLHAFRDATQSWTTELVGTARGVTSAAVDGAGVLHVTYGSGPLMYARKDASGWTQEAVTLPAYAVNSARLRVTSAGTPWVAVQYLSGVFVGHRAVTGWTLEAVASADANAFLDYSLALSSAGEPVVAAYDQPTFEILRKVAGQWTASRIQATEARRPVLDLDSNGKAVVGFVDVASGTFVLARELDGAWSRDVLRTSRAYPGTVPADLAAVASNGSVRILMTPLSITEGVELLWAY